MTVTRSVAGDIALVGDCPAGDAEILLQYLLEAPQAAVDWRDCETAHTAVVQVLLVAARPMLGPPGGAFLRDWVQTAVARR